jgi:tRNA (adenine57-N1/adenine58-N1)-methyltransferase
LTETSYERPRALISDGDLVLLYREGKKWLVRVKSGSLFHTHAGIINHDDLVGRPFGTWVTTSLGEKVWALRPLMKDIILKAERATQILYPKEWGYIVAQLGIGPGSKVLEVGTGSGAFTTFAAHLVRPHGHVYSYEIRPEFHALATRNISKAGLAEYVTLRLADARKGVEETGLDAAVVDIGDPESVLPAVSAALAGSAPMAVAVPTVNQLERVVSTMRQLGVVDIEVCELLLRRWETKIGALRPSTRMIGHTTYLVFGRNVLGDAQLS